MVLLEVAAAVLDDEGRARHGEEKDGREDLHGECRGSVVLDERLRCLEGKE